MLLLKKIPNCMKKRSEEKNIQRSVANFHYIRSNIASCRSIIFSKSVFHMPVASIARKWLRAIIRRIFFVPTSLSMRGVFGLKAHRARDQNQYNQHFPRVLALKNNAYVSEESYPLAGLLMRIILKCSGISFIKTVKT